MIKKIKKYYYPFTYCHHTPEKLLEEYTLNEYKDEKLIPIVKYISELPDFEQVVFLLFSNYNSLRLVAEETNCHYLTINNIIKKIREEIKNILEKK